MSAHKEEFETTTDQKSVFKALWDELWFVNMGYTNKIWLIDWLI